MGQIEPWKSMSPSEGDAPHVTLKVFLQTSADCYEVALQSMIGASKRTNWAKSVFNMLLKRAGDAKKTDKKTKKKKEGGGDGGVEGSRNKSSMQVARETLFALLRGAQVLAPKHPRAMLFAAEALEDVHGDQGGEVQLGEPTWRGRGTPLTRRRRWPQSS